MNVSKCSFKNRKFFSFFFTRHDLVGNMSVLFLCSKTCILHLTVANPEFRNLVSGSGNKDFKHLFLGLILHELG